jgi:hypothetical protein
MTNVQIPMTQIPMTNVTKWPNPNVQGKRMTNDQAPMSNVRQENPGRLSHHPILVIGHWVLVISNIGHWTLGFGHFLLCMLLLGNMLRLGIRRRPPSTSFRRLGLA